MRARNGSSLHQYFGIFNLAAHCGPGSVMRRARHAFDNFPNSRLRAPLPQLPISMRHTYRRDFPLSAETDQTRHREVLAGRLQSELVCDGLHLWGTDVAGKCSKIRITGSGNGRNNIQRAMRVNLPASTGLSLALVGGKNKIMSFGVGQRSERFHQRSQRYGATVVAPVAGEKRAGVGIEQKIGIAISGEFLIQGMDKRLGVQIPWRLPVFDPRAAPCEQGGQEQQRRQYAKCEPAYRAHMYVTVWCSVAP